MTTDRARLAKILGYTSGGLLAASGGLTAYTLLDGIIASARFKRALRRQRQESVADLVGSGIFPKGSRIVSKPDAVEKAILDDHRARTRRNVIRDLLAGIQARSMARQVSNGTNAFYIGGRDKPVFALPERTSRSLVLHEIGHSLADRQRAPGSDYVREYQAAARRFTPIASLLRSGARMDSKGRLTRVGLEEEAWDNAPGRVDQELRDSAVGTYRSAERKMPSLLLSLILGTAGLGAGIGWAKLNTGFDGKR